MESTRRIDLRPLRTDEDFAACVELQQLIWGDDVREMVPPALLKVCQRVGGIAAGAFDQISSSLTITTCARRESVDCAIKWIRRQYARWASLPPNIPENSWPEVRTSTAHRLPSISKMASQNCRGSVASREPSLVEQSPISLDFTNSKIRLFL